MAELDDWESSNPASAAPSPGVTQPTGEVEDWESQGGPATGIDPATGSEIPLTFSGLSPETAQNKSIVSAMDRLKMSVGNTKGNTAYLKSKKEFADVRPVNPEDPNGDLAVLNKADGKWYRVDPKNGEMPDPWKLTQEKYKDLEDLKQMLRAEGEAKLEHAREYTKDVADMAPALAGAGVGLIAGPTIGAGAAFGLGTAMGAGRTSLGREIGTYQASPLEQAWDSAFEGILNAAGVRIAGGLKPEAKWVAEHIPGVAKAFEATKKVGSAGANMGKDLLKKVFAGASVGIDNFDTMLEHPEAVKSVMNTASARAGRNVEAYHDDITLNQMKTIQNFADNARTMLSGLYARGRNAVLAKVSPQFAANFDEPIGAAYRQALSKNLAKIKLGDGKELVGTEAAEYLAKNPSLQGVKFSLLTQDEMKAAIREGAELSNDLGYLATSKEAYETISGFYKNLSDLAGSKNRQGVEAAKDLLNFKRLASDRAYDLTHQEHIRSLPGVKRIIDQARTGIDDAILNGLNKSGAGAGDEFLKLNRTYAKISDELVPVLNARERFAASKDIKVYEGLLNSFTARPGKGVGTKYAVDQAIEAAESYGMKETAEALAGQKVAVQVGQAAKAFNPIKPGWAKAADSIGGGMAIYAAATGNVGLMAALAGQAILRSPNMTAKPAAWAVTRGFAQGQEFLSRMSASDRAKFLADPQMINSFITGITASPQIQQQAEDALSGMLPQQGPPQ